MPTSPSGSTPSGVWGWSSRTGKPLLYTKIADEMLVEAAVDDRHLELLRAVGFRSAVIVPMRLGDEDTGRDDAGERGIGPGP